MVALNHAIDLSRHDYILTLNPDIHISQENIDQLINLANQIPHDRWLLLAPDTGSSPILTKDAILNDQLLEAKWVSGAVMLINRKILNNVKGFDPAFFFF